MFTKGQNVIIARRNDSVMTWTWRAARVEGCGKVRMVLTDAETGECIGREFAPREAQRGYMNGPTESYVFAAFDEERIRQAAEEMRAFELAMYRNQLAVRPDNEYARKALDRLESAEFVLEPWCEWHPAV